MVDNRKNMREKIVQQKNTLIQSYSCAEQSHRSGNKFLSKLQECKFLKGYDYTNRQLRRVVKHSDSAGLQGGPLELSIANKIQTQRSIGRPLDSNLRREAEQRLGADLSLIRVHTNSVSAELNCQVGARAFTTGRDIFFGDGESPYNRQLLLHEATHCLQQGMNEARPFTIGAVDSGAERAAEHVSHDFGFDYSTRRTISKDYKNRLEKEGGDTLKTQSFAQSITSRESRVQRSSNDSHNLKSPRFSGIQKLEACFDNRDRLRRGDAGEAVIRIQQALIDLGYNLGDSGVLRNGADGYYGSMTAKAVLKFKIDFDLTPSIYDDVGPKTMAKLDDLFSKDIFASIPPDIVKIEYKRPPKRDPTLIRDTMVKRLKWGTSYQDYCKNFATTTFFAPFGVEEEKKQKIALNTEMVKLLNDVKGELELKNVKPQITHIGTLKDEASLHTFGLAIDIDPQVNPYILNERGAKGSQKEINERRYDIITKRILNRICLFIEGVPSKLSETLKIGYKNTEETYDALSKESQAMRTYFEQSRDQQKLENYLKSEKGKQGFTFLWYNGYFDFDVSKFPSPDGNLETEVALMSKQMQLDFSDLQSDPSPDGDRPFTSHNPQVGFLNLNKDMVIALRRRGLRWGAVDFTPNQDNSNGDIQHFDMANRRDPENNLPYGEEVTNTRNQVIKDIDAGIIGDDITKQV